MSESVLVVKDLTAGYGPVPTVIDISLKADAGSVSVLVGLNGAGKSTILKALAGVINSSAGQILLNGVDVRGTSPERLLRHGIAYVPQVDNVFPSLSVRENLEMGGYILKAGIKEKIAEVIELFPDLQTALGRPARTLSGGQRIMLAVARGLMTEPKVLLLDEPTAGLAPRFETVVWEQIMAIKTSGVALVVVDQNVRRALASADWGYVFALGRNHVEGEGGELLRGGRLGDLLGKERESGDAIQADQVET